MITSAEPIIDQCIWHYGCFGYSCHVKVFQVWIKKNITLEIEKVLQLPRKSSRRRDRERLERNGEAEVLCGNVAGQKRNI